ncbi:PAS domain-containing protein [Methanosarcina sp. UBA5]|uniref:PAS domain-containing protein n=1 Tax=Methanosarcina sp. UBA5 TaxID=1915593 RepID=UPI0025D32649|nr:PAS domain-containing protein [Methanosarcina sp. UBA5]
MTEKLSPEIPSIFLRLGTEGTVLCANRAAGALLEYWGIKEGEKVPQALRHSLRRVLTQEDPKNLEIQAGKATYAVVLYPFPEKEYVNLEGFDISFGMLTEEKTPIREKQYLTLSTLSTLSRMPLTCKNFQAILEESAMLIAKGLSTEFSRIMELMPDGTFIMRAGYGWEKGLTGNAGTTKRTITKENSQAEHTLVLRRPIIMKYPETETRFECSEFLRQYGIASGVTVLIGDMNKPFGIMEVYSGEKRKFNENDIHFLNSAAFLLSEIIERLHAEEEFRIHQQELEELAERRKLEYKETNEKLVHEIMERRKIENKLQNNVQFLETLLDNIPSPVFQRDLNEIYVNCNESFARQILGLPKEEVIGVSFREFQKRVPKELAEIYHKDDRSLIEKEGSNYYETKVICADGVQRDFLFHKATYQDSSAEVAGVVGVMLDITLRKAAEKTFRKSEERYRIAAEQTGQIVYDYNTKKQEVDWAGAITELTGYNFDEFQKISPEIWLEHIHPDDREKVIEKVRLFFERGGRLREEFRFRRKDGNYIYVEDRGVLLRDEEGSAYRLIGVMKDITKLKLIQESLERSEERYRIAAEQTGQIVYHYDRLTGKIEWAGAIKELTQYSLEEFQNFNRNDWEVNIHPDNRKKIIEKLEQYRESGERFSTEYRFRRKDGSYLYVEDSGIFLKDEQGHSYRDIGVMKDITGLKLASKKLKESEERYRSFMKNFRGIAFQGDLDFKLILLEGSVEEITGYREEDFISGKVNWHQIVLPEDWKKLVNNNERLKNDPLLFIEHEYRIRHRDGKIKWVREIVQNISDPTDKKRILHGAVYDITGQKEAEESLKKMEEIRKKEIHHRIKNNLQVISSLLELQAERFSEKEVLEAFRESQNRVATMAIIHEELYRSRNNEIFNFSEYLQKLTSDLLRSYNIRKEDIKMCLDIEEIFLGMDTATPLGIIINELISNSLKHAFPQGRKGEIRIKLCKAEENVKNKSISNSTNNIGTKSSVNKSSQYSLVVSDNGLGFPEDLDFRNTGSLGLQLVNILVEQLEGTIELQKGTETTFKILFRENN